MLTIFTQIAWDEYTYWQKTDMKVVKKINKLLKEITRTPFDGIGKPEPLKYDLTGYWSRRINQEHRLIYKVTETQIKVISCRYHYDD